MSPNHRLFAEFLGRGSEKNSGGVECDNGTDPDRHVTVGDIRLQNLDSHRSTLVSPLENLRKFAAIHRDRHGFIVAIRDLGRFWDALVTVTQFA